MSNLDKDIKANGFVMGGEYDSKGNYYWAEIAPSGGKWYRQFLPNVKRWWFEVNETEVEPTDKLGIGTISHAYTKYGGNSAWTLRGCMIKAQIALETASTLQKGDVK